MIELIRALFLVLVALIKLVASVALIVVGFLIALAIARHYGVFDLKGVLP